MKRALPWSLVAALLIALAVSGFEIQRLKGRIAKEAALFSDVRQFLIHSTLSRSPGAIVLLGDSITQNASFPAEIEGRPLVNAGIGQARMKDLLAFAPNIFSGTQPSLIVMLVGTNDRTSHTIQADFRSLVLQLKTYAPCVVALSAPHPVTGPRFAADGAGIPYADIEQLPGEAFQDDGVHLNDIGNLIWTSAVVSAIKSVEKFCYR